MGITRRFATVMLGVFLALAPSFAQTPAEEKPGGPHARKLAEIRKLMKLMGGEKMADDIFEQLSANMKAVGGPASEQTLLEFRKEMDFSKLMEVQVQAYDKYMSVEDIEAMIGFYESPAGQRALAAMPKIMNEIMGQSLQISREMADKARRKLQEKK